MLIILSTVLAFALYLTWQATKEMWDSARAHKKISAELNRNDEEIVAETSNQLDLEAIFHGSAVYKWADKVQRANADQGERDLAFPDIIRSFLTFDGLVRDVKEDLTQYSNTPLANLLRSLSDIPGTLNTNPAAFYPLNPSPKKRPHQTQKPATPGSLLCVCSTANIATRAEEVRVWGVGA